MTTNTDETFIRTSPPLNRFTVKLGGPAPWEILSAADARRIAQDIRLFVAAGILSGLWGDDAATLRRYAETVDALTRGHDARTFHEYLDDLAEIGAQ